jgi:16S rRNA (guanine527-N7)-methyltransferase
MDKILNKFPLLNKFNVSRETCFDFEEFISMIIEKNKEINVISLKTASKDMIIERHIADTAQIIDFIDLNSNTTTDLGTGGGFPGIVIAIILKNMKKKIKINLYEKSYHKSLFLKKVSRKLNLNTEVMQTNIFETEKLKTGSIMTRAFKPLPVILDLVCKNFISYENLIIFMGKSGEKVLEEVLKDWELDFEKKNSVTGKNSFLLNIKKIKKK